MSPRFFDAYDGGRLLAYELARFADASDVLVLALPGSGMLVGFEVARSLDVGFDVFVVEPIRSPDDPARRLGAVASGGVCVFDDVQERPLRGSLEAALADARAELCRRERLYRGDRPMRDIADRTVLLVDELLATESSLSAALRALRLLQPRSVVVTAPAGSRLACDGLSPRADEIVCLQTSAHDEEIDSWYQHPTCLSDEQVLDLLTLADDLSAIAATS